jgi:hypothetical protein
MDEDSLTLESSQMGGKGAEKVAHFQSQHIPLRD